MLEKYALYSNIDKIKGKLEERYILYSVGVTFVISFLISFFLFNENVIFQSFGVSFLISVLTGFFALVYLEISEFVFKVNFPGRDLILANIAKNSAKYKQQLQSLHEASAKVTNIIANGNSALGVNAPKAGEVSQQSLDDFQKYLFNTLVNKLYLKGYDFVFPERGVGYKIGAEPEDGMLSIAHTAKIASSLLPKFTTITVYADGTVKCHQNTGVTEITL
jgi:hypothetical protein